MIRKFRIPVLLLITISLFIVNCSKDNGLNIFTVNQDMEFGEQMSVQISESPTDYPVLSETEHPEAYTHLRRIRDALLSSDDLKYADRFDWEVKIIDDDILNAFAAPGGYMYFYSGLIKFLDNEAQFAGVMAHEMAHADKRHSTKKLTKIYGFQILLSALLGKDPGTIAEIATGLATGLSSLAFSRANEYEADEFAVKYLYDTDYHPKGISGFFEKLESHSGTPTFLSTHPSPDDRLEAIDEVWTDLGGKTGETYVDQYQDFKDSL